MAAATMSGQQQGTEMTASEKFFRYFQHEVTDLQEQMTRLETLGMAGGERTDAVDHCLAGIARLSNEVKDAAASIPAYDQRTYSEAIKALSNKLQNVRSQVAPKPRFAFKSSFTARKNESAISLNDAAELANQKRKQVPGYLSDASGSSSFVGSPAESQSPAPEQEDQKGDEYVLSSGITHLSASSARVPAYSQNKSTNIANHDNQHIILPSSAAHATSSGTLANLRRCVVDLSRPTTNGHPFAALTLKNISSSLIICGHVAGAVHITNVTNSIIVVASRQFRMHDSSACDIYLHASGRPIIEDSKNVRFAPLPAAYEGSEEQSTENQWQNVDDFKWLKAERSPNWSLIDEDKQINEGVWRDLVPGGFNLSTDDILRAVNLPL